jgi:mannose-6-phosphate isomerase-like protein (cupin superfamily)
MNALARSLSEATAFAMHRFGNPGKVPPNLIEVQSGTYLGEDDIVRVPNVYHRV